MSNAAASSAISALDGALGDAHLTVVGGLEQIEALMPMLGRLADQACDLRIEITAADITAEGGRARAALDSMAAATLTIVAFDATSGLSEDVRRSALLAYRLSGAPPILALAGRRAADAGAYGEALADWNRYAEGLGIGAEDRVVIDASGDARSAERSFAEVVRRLVARRQDWLAADHAIRLLIATPPTAGTISTTIVEGELVSGTLAPGRAVVALPSATAAKVVSVSQPIHDYDQEAPNVRVELDKPVDIGRGSWLTSAEGRPEQADQVVAHLVWLGRKPMLPGRSYVARLGNQLTTAKISTLKHRVDPAKLDPIAARRLEQASVGLCNVSFDDQLVFDTLGSGAAGRRTTARFVLEDRIEGGVVGIGDVVFTLRRATNIHWQALAVDKSARSALKGQRPACLWFTGLSGSGKSTVASLLEKRLNAMGRHTYTLDGDNVRHGLNRDLGFTDADRVENIRRVSEVSRLMVDAGLIVLVSFISPFRAERRMARGLFPAGEFIEVFVDTPLEICEQRDVKGLYKKARAGQLKNFTGIDSPYEPPEGAEVVLPGGETSPEQLVERLIAELARRAIV